jgi:hypothetical protein
LAREESGEDVDVWDGVGWSLFCLLFGVLSPVASPLLPESPLFLLSGVDEGPVEAVEAAEPLDESFFLEEVFESFARDNYHKTS